MKFVTFQMTEKINDRIAQNIQMMNVVIKTSIRIYIFFDRMKSSIRKMLQFLFNKYKRLNDEIIKQLFEQLQQLKVFFTKKNRIMNNRLKKHEKYNHRAKHEKCV